MTDAAQVLRGIIRENIDAFVESTMKVVDTRGRAIPFKYRHGQREVAKIQADADRSGKPLRLYVLKSRQIGITTQTANRNFVKAFSNDNRRAVTVAHLESRASEILGKLKFAYSNLPEILKFELAQDSKNALGWADFNSKMFICSAATIKAIEMARGDTLQDVHASELTRYADPEYALFELQQVCHLVEGTSIVIETTGKRYGSYAHELWRAAKAGKVIYTPKFLPWQDDPECDLDKSTWTDYERDMRMKEIWEYEPQLIERAKMFELKPGCTYWAYLQLRDQCNGIWDRFLEDYPCSEDEAWQSKGELFFGSDSVMKLARQVEKINGMKFNMSLVNLEDGFKSFGDLQENPSLDVYDKASPPHIIVWKLPLPGRSYVVSGDSSSGNPGGDPSSTFVIDMYSGEMMAEYNGLCRPHQHARIMASLATIYNMALCVPEVNSMGMATLQFLMRDYGNVWRWRKLDSATGKISGLYGWYTATTSRQLMLTLLLRVAEETANGNPSMEGCIKSPGLVDEMRTFIDNPATNKPEAAQGFHDDRVLSLAIAWYVAQLETRGAQEDILSVLRPQEVKEEAGLLHANGLDVEQAVNMVRNHLRMEEYKSDGY